MKRLLLFAAVTLVASNLLAGYTYHFEVVISSAWSNATITGMASVDGKKLRIDFEKGDNFQFPDGGILISTDGENVHVFDPAARTYYDVTLGVLLNPASGMTTLPDGSTIELSYTNPKVDVRDEGEGGEIAGFRTRRYTVHTSYDMHSSLTGKPLGENHFEITSEIWATDALPAGLRMFLLMQGFRMGIESVDKLLDAHPISGFPLRQVTTHTGTYGARSRSWTMEANVTAVRKAPIAASQFRPPAGYTRVERPNPMQQAK